MSALFQLEPGNLSQSATAHRELELRQIPLLTLTSSPPSADDGYVYAADVLANLFTSLSTNWMYSAAIQLALNGSQPAWSLDGWSFIPLDVSNIANSSTIQHTGNLSENGQVASSIFTTNISATTPAIRGRIECSPYEGLQNLSSWLTTWDLANSSTWNVSVNPKGITTGYELGADKGQSMIYLPDPSKGHAWNPLLNTSIFANPSEVTCCSYGTSQPAKGAAVGYWSPNNPEDLPFVDETWPINFTVKWIYGHALSGFYQVNKSYSEHLMFTDVPSISALNCKPIIETATADVTVDQGSGQVQGFEILDDPVPAARAWTDVFVVHNRSSDYIPDAQTEPNKYGQVDIVLSNVTTR
jgi:hypothetical protein